MNKNILIIALSGIVLTLGILFFINKQLSILSQEQISNQQRNIQGTSSVIAKTQSTSSATDIAKSITIPKSASSTTASTTIKPVATPAKVAANKITPSAILPKEDLLSGKWLWQYSTDENKKEIASVKTLDFSQLSKPSMGNKYEAPNLKIEATSTLPFTHSSRFLYNLDECSGGPIYHNFVISGNSVIPSGRIIPYAGEGCRPAASNKEIYDHLEPFFKSETKTMQIVSVTANELVLSYPEPKTYFYFTEAQ